MAKITLEQLALMVQKGFEDTMKKDEFFILREEMDHHFNAIEKMFTFL